MKLVTSHFDSNNKSVDSLASKNTVLNKETEAQKQKIEVLRAALANDMFGKSGQDLLPLLNQTEEAAKDLLDEAENYGMIMSNDAVKASALRIVFSALV